MSVSVSSILWVAALVLCWSRVHCLEILPTSLRSPLKTLSLPQNPPSSLSRYHDLLNATSSCIQISREKFISGNDYYSNPKPQMGTWIDLEQIEHLMAVIDDIYLNSTSPMQSLLKNSKIPMLMMVNSSDEFDINVMHIPQGGRIPMRTHAAGTLLLYKVLTGKAQLVASLGDRVIQSDILSVYDPIKSRTLRRLGGPSRSMQSINFTDCTVIELALNPPKASDPAYDGGINVILDTSLADDPNIITMTIPSNYLSSLFISRNSTSGAMIPSQGPNIPQSADKLKRFQQSLSTNIGGLGQEIKSIIRRILLTRNMPPEVVKTLGLQPVRGMLLYGPPGTGKTLMAREIARVLDAREPKIVNGPEILDKFVGEAEKNIRALFADAIQEWSQRGEKSALHVIIFDEFDSIAKRRGSMVGDNSGVRDSCVNQLLAIMDGIYSLNNILVIGLTNRIDLIDPAMLRPGRMEVQLEIKLPDLAGREEILAILLRPMVHSQSLSLDKAVQYVNQLSRQTDEWTGADLTGLIRSMGSFVIERYLTEMEARNIDPTFPLDDVRINVMEEDVARAMQEITASQRQALKASRGVVSIKEKVNRFRKWIFRRSLVSAADEMLHRDRIVGILTQPVEDTTTKSKFPDIFNSTKMENSENSSESDSGTSSSVFNLGGSIIM